MRVHVVVQSLFTGECLVTLGASVRLLTRVRAHVLVKIGLIVRRVRAGTARMALAVLLS